MSEAAALVLPPPSDCVICGRQLETARQECPDCFDSQSGDETAGLDEIESWLRRARGWMILGLTIFGFVLQPLAFRNAARAMEIYDRGGLRDASLSQRIRWHQGAALVLFGASLALNWALLAV
ncbi:MAG: hypothetical protein AAF657_24940 [Acidobacteriota bacterium]